jgi:hypothetical protein
MTPEERFERIEAGMQRLVELQEINQKTLGTLVASISGYVDSSNAFVQSSNAYVQASNARMLQMEANLDALIRAITLEHGNGKGGK